MQAWPVTYPWGPSQSVDISKSRAGTSFIENEAVICVIFYTLSFNNLAIVKQPYLSVTELEAT